MGRDQGSEVTIENAAGFSRPIFANIGQLDLRMGKWGRNPFHRLYDIQKG